MMGNTKGTKKNRVPIMIPIATGLNIFRIVFVLITTMEDD
jgi:hypothetical protein